MQNRATSARSGGVRDLLDVLGAWAEGHGPLYRRLARSIAAAVERGALPEGTRLPSERDLAHHLSIGRGTAVAALDVLVAEDLVERRRGSGTFVSAAGRPALPIGREGTELVHRLVARGADTSDLVDLSISVLHEPRGMEQLRDDLPGLVGAVPDTGYAPRGLPSLLHALADHLTDSGLPTSAEQLVVTTGAQQAISVAAACWVRPGDVVVVDDPTYPGAIAAFEQAGARVRGVPVDRHGIRVDALASALCARPALVYLQSTVHSPTGGVLSMARRRRVAELVAATRIPLVEDIALGDLSWSEAQPPIASLVPDESVAVVGSCSKTFWGGLRIGFVRAPVPLALRLARIKATRDLGSSAVSQVLAERLLRSFAGAPPRLRRAADLRARYEVLAATLAARLPAWRWQEPAGGLSIWAQLPSGSASAFAQQARRFGVAVAGPGPLSVSGRDDHVRLSFAAAPDVLEEGVRRLASVPDAGER